MHISSDTEPPYSDSTLSTLSTHATQNIPSNPTDIDTHNKSETDEDMQDDIERERLKERQRERQRELDRERVTERERQRGRGRGREGGREREGERKRERETDTNTDSDNNMNDITSPQTRISKDLQDKGVSSSRGGRGGKGRGGGNTRSSRKEKIEEKQRFTMNLVDVQRIEREKKNPTVVDIEGTGGTLERGSASDRGSMNGGDSGIDKKHNEHTNNKNNDNNNRENDKSNGDTSGSGSNGDPKNIIENVGREREDTGGGEGMGEPSWGSPWMPRSWGGEMGKGAQMGGTNHLDLREGGKFHQGVNRDRIPQRRMWG